MRRACLGPGTTERREHTVTSCIHSLTQATHRTHDPAAGSDFVLRAEEHGVPQARHRVIIVGVRDDFTDATTRAVLLAANDPVPDIERA